MKASRNCAALTNRTKDCGVEPAVTAAGARRLAMAWGKKIAPAVMIEATARRVRFKVRRPTLHCRARPACQKPKATQTAESPNK